MKLIDKIKKFCNKFWNKTLGPDYESEELAELKMEDPINVPILEKSSESIDGKVANYGGSSNVQRRKLLENVRVKGKVLKNLKIEQVKGKQQQIGKDERTR